MAERVLAYDRTIVPQETGWYCGPASVQVALNARGVVKSERELALRLERYEGNVDGRGQVFDDQDGTDHIGQVTRVVTDYLPAAKMATVEYPKDPPTAALKDQLWNHLRASIDAGFGMVANIVSPPSNRWRLAKPSTVAPNYGSVTVWHYVAIMGYSDVGGVRKVWVADPGFAPHGWWATLDSLASLIPPKGYSYSTAASKPVTAPLPDAPAVAIPKFTEVRDIGQSHQARTRAPINFLLHTSQSTGDARALANYCKNPANSASYHFILGSGQLIQIVDTSRASWSVLDANAYTINLCFSGSFAEWSRAEWLKRRDDIRIAAYIAVREARKAGISVDVLRPGPYRRGSGISDHKYVTEALGIGTHTDVGKHFPWDLFAADVLAFVQPAFAPVNLIDAEAARAAAWIGKRLAPVGVAGETVIRRDGAEVGRFVVYEHAHIYWKTGTRQAFAVPHADPALPGTGLFETWGADYRWEQGPLGFPDRAHAVVTNGAVQAFAHGVLFRKNGQPRGYAVWGRIYDAYRANGSEQGPLGWPTSPEEKVADTDNVQQRFEHGRLVWSPSGVAVLIDTKELAA
ncbi:C39 family peptidase [Gordonia phosphorivorans]|uniref:C39 family peptidase n=1 Tax=Gordonia phosphorivorans TaxID=1056982 RepID=A0ABV6H6H5_9ACTN